MFIIEILLFAFILLFPIFMLPSMLESNKKRKKQMLKEKEILNKLSQTIKTSLNSANFKCKYKYGIDKLLENVLCQINANENNIVIYFFDSNKTIINLEYKNILNFNIFNDVNTQTTNYKQFVGNGIFLNKEKKVNTLNNRINIKYKSKNNEILDLIFSTDDIDELNNYNSIEMQKCNIIDYVNERIKH